MYYAILAFMLASSFLIANIGDGIRVPKEIACIAGFLTIYFISNKRRPFKNAWLKGFVLWGFLLTTLLVKDMKCFYELFYVLAAYLAISTLATTETLIPSKFNLKLGKFLPKHMSFDEQVQGIMRFACWMVVIMASYVYIQAIGWDSINIVKGFHRPCGGTFEHRIIGTLGNPAVLSSWFALVLPFFLFQKDKKFLFLFLYCMVAMGLSGSFVGIIAALFGITIVTLYKSKRLFYILIIIGMIAGAFLFHPRAKEFVNPHGRIKAWKLIYNAWHKGYENPRYPKDDHGHHPLVKSRAFFGYGPGKFKYIIPGLTNNFQVSSDTPWHTSHCEPLDIAFNYGVVGLILYSGFCGSVLLLFVRRKKTDTRVALFASSSAFFVSSLGFFPMNIGATAFLGVINVGLLINLLTREEKKDEKIHNFSNFFTRTFTMS